MNISYKNPKVSVCVVTYNQEKYISQCLQSLVDQETDFPFEILVSDDCSTDNTREIITSFVRKFPLIVKPIFHEKNIGAYENFAYVHQIAKGEYIAHVDGDDYCLPGKLQAQSDILDTDSACNIVWHRMLIETSDGSLREGPFFGESKLSALRFDRGLIIQLISIGMNSSKMYRNSVRDFVKPPFDLVDYFANVEQVGTGYARFVNDINYGVYRLGIGIASKGTKTRTALKNSFLYFHKKYPEHRLQVNTAVLTYFLADLKNMRSSALMFGILWIKTFHLFSISNLLKHIKIIKKLKLQN